tara:strand:- start:3012 stop:3197 length:186 start_codon:yes stop_codon:yes gene_type:complete
MDDFKLDCMTEIKTHDEALAARLMKHWHDNIPTGFGLIASYERFDGLASTLWIFKLMENKQ